MKNLETLSAEILKAEQKKLKLEYALLEYTQDIEEKASFNDSLKLKTEHIIYNDSTYKNEKARKTAVQELLNQSEQYSKNKLDIDSSNWIIKRKSLDIKSLRKEIDHQKRLFQIKLSEQEGK